MIDQSKFSYGSLPQALAEDLMGLNPWWSAEPARFYPSHRRWLFNKLRAQLTSGLTQAVALRGPRRVGKTILMRQLIEAFLAEGIAAQRILYVPFDEIEHSINFKDPILAIARWFEANIAKQTFKAGARGSNGLYFF